MIVMHDSVTLDAIPAGAVAVAGYTSGNWPTYAEVVKRWPNAHHLSIAVSADQDADVLDIERGDATPAQAAVWFTRQIRRGLWRPCFYISASMADALILDFLEPAGITRPFYRLWTAHGGAGEHICGPMSCGLVWTTTADGTQWTARAGGANLDQSILRDDFFGPNPKPPLDVKGAAVYLSATDPVSGAHALCDADGNVFSFNADGSVGGVFLGTIATLTRHVPAFRPLGPVVAFWFYDDGNADHGAYVMVLEEAGKTGADRFHPANFPSDGRFR